ncbi:MAG: hypothetical protein ACXWQO_09005 [Bdellovibrionota bacterium]
MTENLILFCFLSVGFVLAPLMTNAFFLRQSRTYAIVHIVVLLLILISVLPGSPHIALAWPLFCTWGFFCYLKNECKFTITIKDAAGCVPFIFSLISATWFFAGVNDLHLLGYSRAWSFYAALHGIFLGWILVGCLAYLAKTKTNNALYLYSTLLAPVLFLFVAFGIDGVPYVKRIGVIGFSVMAPLLIARYSLHLEKRWKLSRLLSLLSLVSLVASMCLALLNEFWADFPRVTAGMPTMVLTHGLLNAVIAVPCFFLAIWFENPREKSD